MATCAILAALYVGDSEVIELPMASCLQECMIYITDSYEKTLNYRCEYRNLPREMFKNLVNISQAGDDKVQEELETIEEDIYQFEDSISHLRAFIVTK